ncbi:exonuclease domain-containing protein [Georgenia halophila]|uniref:Exonuclease domain-containing protein n=1 Tax=Georgenia halophila TaxID=620889 RepID=A0ABP8KVP0_9MICO
MSSWCDGEFLGFDTETTGVDVTSDRIVSAALVLRRGATSRVRTWLVDPGVEIPPAASAINGITTDLVRASGSPPAVALEEIASALVRAQRDGVPLVAYNAAFDLVLLDNELVRHGLPRLAERLRPCLPVIDPLLLDRALDGLRDAPRTLGDLCMHYGVATRADLHTAEVDVLATLDVLTGIAAAFPQIGEMSLPDLHSWQVTKYREWAEGHNARRAAEQRPGRDVDPGWPMPVEELASAS